MTTWRLNNKNFVAYKNNKLAGMVSQNPDDPRVMDPGLWTCVMHITDEGLIALGVYKTAIRARIALTHALNRRWTYTIWMRWGIRNTQQAQRVPAVLLPVVRVLRELGFEKDI